MKTRSVVLFQEKRKDIQIIVTAHVSEAGELVIEGYDVGSLVKDLRGEYQYEYTLKIKAEEKNRYIQFLQNKGHEVKEDANLLAFLKANYQQNDAFSKIQKSLNEIGIKSEFFSWG